MKHPGSLLIVLLLSLHAFQLYSQPGAKQEKRHEWFIKRRNHEGVNIEEARWKAYELSKQQTFKSAAPLPVANWQCLGPANQGGRIISYAFDPGNTQTLWVGAASGGLWRTSDGGDNWQPMTDQLPNLAIGAVVINPQNPNEMLIGTGEGYVLSSYFLYGVGVLRSTDGGNTWSPTGLAVADSLMFACLGMTWNAVNSNYVQAATTYGIFSSSNGGISWSYTLPGIATSIVQDKQNPSTVYAALQHYGTTSTGGIYKSTDNGFTWQQMTAGLPSSSATGFTTIAIHDVHPDILFASISMPIASSNTGSLQGLYRSSDGGATWTLVPSSVNFHCYPSPNNNICLGWYANVLAISPLDTNRLFAGSPFLYTSGDGGITWSFADLAPNEPFQHVHADHHAFAFDPSNPQTVYSFNDGGVAKSTDGGNTWYEKNNGLVTFQNYSAASSQSDPGLIVSCTQDNGIYFSDTAATQSLWTQFTYGDGFATCIDPADRNTWYSTELYKGRFKTADGGSSWSSINNGIQETNTFFTPLVMSPLDPQVMFTATDQRVYRTNNSGQQWTPVASIPWIEIIEIGQPDTGTVYIANAYAPSEIHRSMDGGSTWVQIGSPGDVVTDIETDPYTPGVVYATRSAYTAGQQVWRSNDHGNTWTNISSNFPGIPANTIVLNPGNTDHIYVGTDLGVYLSTDGGATWAEYNDNLPNVIVQDMHYYPADSTLRAGTYGRGYWSTKAADPSLTGMKEQTKDNAHITAHPNPSNSSIMIGFDLGEEGTVSLKIHNALGQEVRVLANGYHNKGEHQLVWDAKNQAGLAVQAGTYYVRIITGNFARCIKVVITK